jgi:hypothetical protein
VGRLTKKRTKEIDNTDDGLSAWQGVPLAEGGGVADGWLVPGQRDRRTDRKGEKKEPKVKRGCVYLFSGGRNRTRKETDWRLKIRKFGEVGECSKLVLRPAWLGGAGTQWQGVGEFKR